MKTRYRTAILFAAIALLFASIDGFAEKKNAPSKSSAKKENIQPGPQQDPKLNSTGVYRVRGGDSLYGIAKHFKTTVEALKAANKLSSNKIKIGQKLKVAVTQSAAVVKQAPKIGSLVIPNQTLTAGAPQKEGPDKTSDNSTQSMPYRLVEAGSRLIGVKYRFSGLSEKSGLDCSGLVKILFAKFNIELPRSSREQYKQGEKVDRDNLEVGDLLFFSKGGNLPTHVGIYVGGQKLLHAGLKAKQVVVCDISNLWNSMRYLGARRIKELWGEKPASTPEKPQ